MYGFIILDRFVGIAIVASGPFLITCCFFLSSIDDDYLQNASTILDKLKSYYRQGGESLSLSKVLQDFTQVLLLNCLKFRIWVYLHKQFIYIVCFCWYKKKKVNKIDYLDEFACVYFHSFNSQRLCGLPSKWGFGVCFCCHFRWYWTSHFMKKINWWTRNSLRTVHLSKSSSFFKTWLSLRFWPGGLHPDKRCDCICL